MDKSFPEETISQNDGMTHKITRLNPDLSVCWEDVDTLRVGFETPCTRVVRPSAGAQRLLARLATGIPTRTVGLEARGLGATHAESRRLLSDLASALVEETPAAGRREARVLRVRVSDAGREVVGLAEALRASGVCAITDATPIALHRAAPAAHVLDDLARCADLAVLVERFIEPLAHERRWLAVAVPHLPIRFTDGAVHVGPLIDAGGSPCHSCVSLAHVDRDPAAPILAAQLQGKRPSAETSAGAHMAAAVAAMIVRAWLAGDPRVHRERFAIPMSRGRVAGPFAALPVAQHAECACSEPADGPGAASDDDSGFRDEP